MGPAKSIQSPLSPTNGRVEKARHILISSDSPSAVAGSAPPSSLELVAVASEREHEFSVVESSSTTTEVFDFDGILPRETLSALRQCEEAVRPAHSRRISTQDIPQQVS